jgi:hypothetical protein
MFTGLLKLGLAGAIALAASAPSYAGHRTRSHHAYDAYRYSYDDIYRSSSYGNGYRAVGYGYYVDGYGDSLYGGGPKHRERAYQDDAYYRQPSHGYRERAVRRPNIQVNVLSQPCIC